MPIPTSQNLHAASSYIAEDSRIWMRHVAPTLNFGHQPDKMTKVTILGAG